MLQQTQVIISTHGRGLIDITHKIREVVDNAAVSIGLCHIFLKHTSASLILCENADPLVQNDLQGFMQKLVPDSNDLYQHTAEGIDDMPAHIRTILTQSFLLIPVTNSKLSLGTWQGIYLWEHRLAANQRKMIVTIYD